MLAAVDIDCESIRASTPVSERINAVNRFNNEDEPVTAFITTIAIGSLGLNLHKACWDGIIAEYAWNMASMDQVQGRLWRLGQANQVHWVICTMANSWYCFKEQKILDKYLADLASSLPLPDEWDEYTHVRNTVYYEFMRCKMGTLFNRYIWELFYKGLFADYDNSDTYAMAEVLSAFARILLRDVLKKDTRSERINKGDLLLLDDFIGTIGLIYYYGLRNRELVLRLANGHTVDEITPPNSVLSLRTFLSAWRPIEEQAKELREKEHQQELQRRKMGRVVLEQDGNDPMSTQPQTPMVMRKKSTVKHGWVEKSSPTDGCSRSDKESDFSVLANKLMRETEDKHNGTASSKRTFCDTVTVNAVPAAA